MYIKCMNIHMHMHMHVHVQKCHTHTHTHSHTQTHTDNTHAQNTPRKSKNTQWQASLEQTKAKELAP